jgi:hypothetical protein
MRRDAFRAVLCIAAITGTTMVSTLASAEDTSKRSCQDWMTARHSGNSQRDELLVTALVQYYYMQAVEDNVPVARPPDDKTIYRELDSYCANRPATLLSEATQHFIIIKP